MRSAVSVRLVVVAFLAALTAGTALAAAGDPEKRAITAADQARAKRAVLTLRDLPLGFRQGPVSKGGPSGPLTCKGFAPDLSDLTITGEAMSHEFARADGTSLFSSAEVYRSVHDERESWRRTARREALPCVARVLEKLSTTDVRLTVLFKTQRSAPRVGDRAISFRIVAAVAANGMRAKVWLDLLGVGRGRMDATLGVITVRAAPSASLERALLSKLARRLRA
jgi:hypothetical protein